MQWLLLAQATPGSSAGNGDDPFLARSTSPVRDTNNCAIRRTLELAERLQYIEAVKCLMEKPPQTSTKDVPGVRNRFEDFLATHIVNADDVHFTVGGVSSPLINAIELTCLHRAGRFLPLPQADDARL